MPRSLLCRRMPRARSVTNLGGAQMGINQALCHARSAALFPRAPLYNAEVGGRRRTEGRNGTSVLGYLFLGLLGTVLGTRPCSVVLASVSLSLSS